MATSLIFYYQFIENITCNEISCENKLSCTILKRGPTLSLELPLLMKRSFADTVMHEEKYNCLHGLYYF